VDSGPATHKVLLGAGANARTGMPKWAWESASWEKSRAPTERRSAIRRNGKGEHRRRRCGKTTIASFRGPAAEQ